MTKEEASEGNRIIQEWMGWKLLSTVSSIDGKNIYEFVRYDDSGDVIDQHCGGDSWGWKENDTFPYHSDWDLLHDVIDKIHNLEEEYPVIKNNFHVRIFKRHMEIVYDYEGHCLLDPDNITDADFKRYQYSFKSYRYCVFDESPIYATWTAVVDFITWFKEQK